jgi:hypothetical protein
MVSNYGIAHCDYVILEGILNSAKYGSMIERLMNQINDLDLICHFQQTNASLLLHQNLFHLSNGVFLLFHEIQLIEDIVNYGIAHCDYVILEGILNSAKYGSMIDNKPTHHCCFTKICFIFQMVSSYCFMKW